MKVQGTWEGIVSTMQDLWVIGQEFQRAPPDRTLDGEGPTDLLDALLREDGNAVQQHLISGAPVGLREAALLGDAVQVRRLLAAGADPFPDRGWSALHLAAWSGRTAIVEALLEEGVPADLLAGPDDDPLGCAALHLAVVRGHRAVVTQLLDAGAWIDRRDGAGFTPLHQAAEADDVEMLKLLIERGARVNALCADTTPLGLAAARGHTRIVRLLTQCGGTD